MRIGYRRWAAGLLALLLAGSLCGCGALPKFTLSAQELYRLPELPEKYTALNALLAEILDGGAEYAAPASGTNIQPVQLADLNGDGKEEAVAFFRKADDEKPLKIYIFSAEDDRYRQTALIEGSGTAIFSVAYSDLDSDGRTELAVGWRASTELQALTVYAIRPDGPVELLRTDYVKYALADLDGNGQQELMVFRGDEAGTGIADYYSWKAGSLTPQFSLFLSGTVAELKQQGRIRVGALREGVPALFVTCVTETGRAVTDILALRGDALANISLAPDGVTAEISGFCGLYPTDLDGDGITEVPRPVAISQEGEAMACQIEWFSYGEDGSAETALSTFHDHGDGWYLRLPDTWRGRIQAARMTTADEAVVTFYALGDQASLTRPFLRITAITGSSPERRAVRGNRFVLSRQSGTIYTAELLDANAGWDYGVTEDEVRGMFSLIAAEWTIGDN